MQKFKDLRNMTFGRLTVLNENPLVKNKQTYWKCKCECGNEKYISARHLKDNTIRSCGCLRQEFYNRGIKNNKKHICKNKRLAKILNHMKQRCYNVNAPNYKNYGGRGIKICDEWLENNQNFYDWSIKNGYSDDLSIDRINVNGNYEPNNCRWATPKQQANNRRNSVIVKLLNQNKTVAEWADYFGITYKDCYQRLVKKG